MKKTKNLILDIGGILINVDYGKTNEAFRALGVANIDTLFTQHHQDRLFSDFETGQIKAPEFRAGVKVIASQPKMSDADFDRAWNAMIISTVPHLPEFINNLKQKYRIFLFSNINEIHLARTRVVCGEAGFDADDLFAATDYAYLSFQFGYRKPDVAGFAKILADHGLQAAETLFIDDTIGNLSGAQELGIKTLHWQESVLLPCHAVWRDLIKN